LSKFFTFLQQQQKEPAIDLKSEMQFVLSKSLCSVEVIRKVESKGTDEEKQANARKKQTVTIRTPNGGL
jgi:hypothetical protein